jgi:hypothetical protein
LDVTIIAGDVFSAFKAAGVDDETAKRAVAEVGDIKRPDPGDLKSAWAGSRPCSPTSAGRSS